MQVTLGAVSAKHVSNPRSAINLKFRKFYSHFVYDCLGCQAPAPKSSGWPLVVVGRPLILLVYAWVARRRSQKAAASLLKRRKAAKLGMPVNHVTHCIPSHPLFQNGANLDLSQNVFSLSDLSSKGAGGPNQNTCVCGMVPGVPTKTRASVVWCRGPQPKTRASVVWCRGSRPKHVANPVKEA